MADVELNAAGAVRSEGDVGKDLNVSAEIAERGRSLRDGRMI